jgi:hypothetical protein
MEKHAPDPINYLRIPKNQLELLGYIRHWKQLKVGYESDWIWIKELSDEQLDSVAIKRIPHQVCYYEKETKLSLKGSLLPSCSIPNILWTPIQRALSLQLPILNHNYFGASDQIKLELVPSKKEQEAYALLSNLEDLGHFIETSAAVRLKSLKWSLVENQALIFGTPTLPIQGAAYWRWNHFLIPAGYDFNYPSLAESVHKSIQAKQSDWIVWTLDSSYYTIDSKHIQVLSLSSYRKTMARS